MLNALQDLLLPTEQKAKQLASSILATKTVRLYGRPQEKSDRTCAPVDISDGVLFYPVRQSALRLGDSE